MTDEQDLIYRRLIDKSWEIGPLPNDPNKLAALVRMQCDRFATAWTFPLKECWHENKQGLLINNRLEDEREFSLSKAVKATKAANTRWKKRNKRLKNQKDKRPYKRNALASSKQCLSDAINDRRSKIEDRDLTKRDLTNSEDHSFNETPSISTSNDKSSLALRKEKAVWADNQLEIDEDWLRGELETFYAELDALDPTAKLRLTRQSYQETKNRLHEKLLITPEQRAVPTSKPSQKRGFATRVLRHFKRSIIDMRRKRYPSFADVVDADVADRLMRAKRARERERKEITNGN